MAYLKKKYRGRFVNRFDREPLEKKIALAWQKLNQFSSGGPDTVDHLANGDGTCRSVELASNEVRLAINTTIQWLGSPVGYKWISDVLGLR
jgi:hypothetical protein